MFSAQIKSWFEARLRGAISHSVRDLSFKVEMGKITSLHLSTYFQEELNIKSTELSLIDQKCVTVCVTEHDGFEPHVHSFFIIIIASFVQSSGSFNPGLFSCPFPSLFHFFHFLCPVLIPPASFLPSPPFSIPLIFPFLDSFLLFLFSFISSFISFLLPFLSIFPPFLLSFPISSFFLSLFVPFSFLLPFFLSLLPLAVFPVFLSFSLRCPFVPFTPCFLIYLFWFLFLSFLCFSRPQSFLPFCISFLFIFPFLCLKLFLLFFSFFFLSFLPCFLCPPSFFFNSSFLSEFFPSLFPCLLVLSVLHNKVGPLLKGRCPGAFLHCCVTAYSHT